MPTGYTADVANGKVTDFRTFALRCARAFGATVMQRDDPADDLPKHREVASFYIDRVAAEEARVAELASMSFDVAEEKRREQYEEAVAYRDQYLADKEAKRGRYEAMLREVRAWNVPTAEHAELKKFMVEQIERSIDFDCGGTYVPGVPAFHSAEEWLEVQRSDAKASLERSRASLEEERTRCDGANAWIDALYESLT